MKRIYLFLLLLLCNQFLLAQSYIPPPFADIDNNYRNHTNNVFGALEANRVPTGFLVDYGFDFTEPKIYNGQVLVDSTLMEQGLYSELYKTIFTSRFNNNTGQLRHPSIHDSLCYIARSKEVITLSGLFFKFNAIDPNAQANGKMQTINGQLRDVYVNGVWQNPYQEFTTVAISPSIISYKLTYCSVVMPSNLFLSNMLSQISNIQFDANDGQGYRNILFDVPLTLNYADTGWKHWVFKVNLTNGQQLYSHSKVHFNNTSNIAGSGGGIAARGIADRRRTIIATEMFNGLFGVADIVISYRNANDLVLRRPLIVAEGFDPGHITSPEEPEGESNFEGFIRTVKNSNSTSLQNLISNRFNPNLPSEYDVVYINWRNGTDWLQRNERVLEEVIRWVNQTKQPLNGIRQPNVVLGSSMGGVIARMALGRMDRNGGFAAHETNLYVSLDAPHQGANVPLGYQALARHATRMYVNTGPAALITEIVQLIRNGPSPLLNLLLADQPASRQLLINRIDLDFNLTNTTNQEFLNELRTSWDYPDPNNVRSIAISNGSECAMGQEFAPGSSLLYHYRSTKTRFIGDLVFMAAGLGLGYLTGSFVHFLPIIIPGSTKFELTLDIRALANGGGNQVYYGNIKLTKKVLWLVPVSINIANKTYNAPYGLLPFDTYPGGFYTVTLANQPGTASQDWMFTYNNSFFIQRRFTFIPTTSALDIGKGNATLTNANYTAKYIGANPPASPFQSPFQNFATAYNIDGSTWTFTNSTFQNLNNEPHEHFFQRNATWLAAEMAVANPQPQFTNCSVFCGLSIAGPDAICDNGTFNVPLITGATYTWIVDNTFLINSFPNINSIGITRKRQGNANITITVLINRGDCGTLTLSKTFQFGVTPSIITGPYDIAQHTVMGVAYTNTTYYFLAGESSPYFPAQSYTWTLFPPTGNPTLYASSQPYISFAEVGYHTLQVAKNTECGVINSEIIINVQEDISGFNVMVAPNPVTEDVVNVTTTNENQQVLALPPNGNMLVELINLNTGIKYKQWILQNQQKQFTLSVTGVPAGFYVLNVTKGNHQRTKQLFIQ